MTQTDKDVYISNINSAKKKKKKDNWFLHSSRFYCLKVTKKVKFFLYKQYNNKFENRKRTIMTSKAMIHFLLAFHS